MEIFLGFNSIVVVIGLMIALYGVLAAYELVPASPYDEFLWIIIGVGVMAGGGFLHTIAHIITCFP